MKSTVDAVILGGGIAALGVGYGLVRRGKKVIFIVPPKPLRGEATPASAGILDPFLESDSLEQPFFRLKKAAFLDFKKQIKNLERATRIDTGFLTCGMYFAAQSHQEERLLKQRFARHKRSGIPLRWLTRAMIREQWPLANSELAGALFYPTIARIYPARLQDALKRFVTKRGAAWITFKGTVKPVVRNGRISGIELNNKVFETQQIVNACGSWAGTHKYDLFPVPVEPVRGQVLVVSGGISVEGPIAHSTQGIYIVPWEKNSYLLGSTVERAGFRPKVNARDLKRIRNAAEQLMPRLRFAKLRESWAGLRPCSPDSMPLIGETPVKGYYVAAGYYRSGIVIGIHAGELLSQGMISGKMPAVLKPFNPGRVLPQTPKGEKRS